MYHYCIMDNTCHVLLQRKTVSSKCVVGLEQICVCMSVCVYSNLVVGTCVHRMVLQTSSTCCRVMGNPPTSSSRQPWGGKRKHRTSAACITSTQLHFQVDIEFVCTEAEQKGMLLPTPLRRGLHVLPASASLNDCDHEWPNGCPVN